MNRRAFLASGSAVGLASLAGCLSVRSESPETTLAPPWRREGEVYHPGHRIGMRMLGTAQTGNLTVGLSYSYPDRFWTVSGRRRNRVGIEQKNDSIHLMASVWDTETETVFPMASGLRVQVESGGDSVTQRALWPMLTQNMGFHFGDNVLIPEWGEHTITVDIGSPSLRRRGDLRDSFEGAETVSFDVNLQLSKRNQIDVARQSTRRGNHAAVEPMEMAMQPLSFAPSTTALPGRLLGRPTSGDGVFVVTAEDSTLVVSPRTPFNGFVLPLMSLSARIDRDGQTAAEGQLTPAIDSTRNYHYRLPVDSLQSGDQLTLSVVAPPQTARHIGYESAFLEMDEMTMTV
jgi:hypothetical protein